ncbi:TonB-dependent receptor [Tenacibaculum maritimum]|uniref:TonB-dependent receptor n=1 Tax=Tenacibaculum maritimum TaxID=107401 RepID=UPI0012E3FE72|nr:TonB-dependent receptor [Tenacibaculum maritimum]MCD9582206.1 TonB-dependent receptor [Tenacibaculum maritimum]MCD9636585.1 TonB-dependent receptor [Tenacibaculum maritimum]CAA0169351.1 conserved hypothetical protein [Tenacibaculum maritimum]CAA0213413.1 conserved hypothetical protein [Tenacibaculum maritimum]CAA0237919.1 conserved hypothetical protein [Tenacibaculum maritimum]
MKKYLLLLAFLSIKHIVEGQVLLKGVVKNEKNVPIAYSNILVKNDSLNKIINYASSNEKGEYQVEFPFQKKIRIEVTALGYERITSLVNRVIANERVVNFILKEKPLELDEIIIEAEKPIVIRKDTIRFKAKRFAKGNEKVVEDLLRNIPNISIDNKGVIKVGKREIEKIMIDGDDFFKKGYKILSKNMPAYAIEDIEVLKKYSNNSLLKGVEDSDKVALNLKINSKLRRVWFGNLSLGYGFFSKNRYEVKGSLMNFGKSNKYYLLASLNNLGYDSSLNLKKLVEQTKAGEEIGDGQSTYKLIELSNLNLALKKERFNFNNTELLSLNSIFKINEGFKIKMLNFFNWDKTGFYRKIRESITIKGDKFSNIEDFQLNNINKSFFSKLNLIHDISRTKKIDTEIKISFNELLAKSSLEFNEDPSREKLKSKNIFFDQKIKYTDKFKDKGVLLLTGRFILEDKPQTYNYNQFLYQGLFPNYPESNNVRQVVENKMEFIGLDARLLRRDNSENLLELHFGNKHRRDRSVTGFYLLEDDTVLGSPVNYQNKISYFVNDLYAKTKYLYKKKHFSIIGELEFHQLLNLIKSERDKKEESLFFINPKFGFKWRINEENKLSFSYSYNKTNASLLEVYPNYYLKNFRTFSRGINDFNQLNEYSINLDYELGNWGNNSFANFSVFYKKENDFFTTNSIIRQNYVLSDKIFVKNKGILGANLRFDTFFTKIKSNLRLELRGYKSNYKNKVNSFELRNIKADNYECGVELRSGLKGFFNYHIGTRWSINNVESLIKESHTNNQSFLNLTFMFNRKLNLNIESERYDFGRTEKDEVYYFSDFKMNYILKKNNLVLGLMGKNLFKLEKISSVSINDISVLSIEHRLLPRHFVFSMQYRF